MDTVTQDLRLAWRAMCQRPIVTIVIVLSLALGIGANTTIFSLANAVLLRPLPFKNEHELLRLRDLKIQPGREPQRVDMTLLNYFALREQSRIFTDVGALHFQNVSLVGSEEPVRLRGSRISHSLLNVLGIEPILGRGFFPEEDQPDAASRVALVGYDLWHRQFGADPDIVDQTVILEDGGYVVVGVLPKGFKYPFDVDIWIPAGYNRNAENAAKFHNYSVVARLRPNVTRQQATTELEALARRLAQEYPDSNAGWDFSVMPLREQLIERSRPRVYLALLAAAGFLLLIACANVTNMLLARSLEQRGEIAMRSALGARRWHLVRQLFVQGLLLAILAGGVALLLTVIILPPLVATSPVMNLSSVFHRVKIDFRVLSFTLGISLLVGCLFSLLPALTASKPQLQVLIQEGVRATVGRGRRRLLDALVVAEIAVAVVLLICAGLMLQSFWNLQRIEPGYDPQNILTMQYAFSEDRYPEDHQKVTLLREIQEGIEALPEVISVGVTNLYPTEMTWLLTGFSVEGQPPQHPEDITIANVRAVSPGYLETMRIPLLQGRTITEQDRADSPGVVIISKNLADARWPDQDPINQRIKQSYYYKSGVPWWTVIGVIDDVMHTGDVAEILYFPYTQKKFRGFVTLVIRTAGDPVSLVGRIREQIYRVDDRQPVFEVATAEQHLSESRNEPRFSAFMISMFAFLGLVLSIVGVYGVLSYSVIQQNAEIGMRMALGAQRGDVLKHVLWRGTVLGLIGLACGLAGAFALTRLLSSLLFEVGSTDPATFIGISLGSLVVVLLASYQPARRATRVDPAVALRTQ